MELSFSLVAAPAELKEKTQAHNGWVCMVTAGAFEDTAEAAQASLKPLENGAAGGQVLGRVRLRRRWYSSNFSTPRGVFGRKGCGRGWRRRFPTPARKTCSARSPSTSQVALADHGGALTIFHRSERAGRSTAIHAYSMSSNVSVADHGPCGGRNRDGRGQYGVASTNALGCCGPTTSVITSASPTRWNVRLTRVEAFSADNWKRAGRSARQA